MKISITKEEAENLHSKYYERSFEIVRMKRSGPMDFFPFSLFYGASDFGSWDGLMSTDGNKFVVTRSSYLNIAEVKNTYQFNRSDIKSAKDGLFKVRFVLAEKIDGLTKGSAMRTLLIFPGVVFYLIPPIFAWKMPQKILEIRTEDEFGSLSRFKHLAKI
jgi:hypothetical protein